MILVTCLLSFGFCFLIFLTISEILEDSLAGFICIMMLGVGASFVIYFSNTIFFGGSFIFPTGYIVAGFLPNLAGHFFGLFLLYIIIKTKLQRWIHVFFSVFLAIMLLLSHPIAFVTYLIGTLSLFISSQITQIDIEFKKLALILFLSILLCSPWWLTVWGELLERPYLFLSGSGLSWVRNGFSTKIIKYYGFIPLFSIIGAINILKKYKFGNFLLVWLIILLLLLFSAWGFRFSLELIVPLYILGAIGISETLKQIFFEFHGYILGRSITFIAIIFVLCDSLRLFDLIQILFLHPSL